MGTVWLEILDGEHRETFSTQPEARLHGGRVLELSSRGKAIAARTQADPRHPGRELVPGMDCTRDEFMTEAFRVANDEGLTIPEALEVLQARTMRRS